MTNEKQDWYVRFIEKSIRPIVRLLRENGFNTFASCGHRMYVLGTVLDGADFERMADLLQENGYRDFRLSFSREVVGGRWDTSFELRLPFRDGKYYPIPPVLPDGFELMNMPDSPLAEGKPGWLEEFQEDDSVVR